MTPEREDTLYRAEHAIPERPPVATSVPTPMATSYATPVAICEDCLSSFDAEPGQRVCDDCSLDRDRGWPPIRLADGR